VRIVASLVSIPAVPWPRARAWQKYASNETGNNYAFVFLRSSNPTRSGNHLVVVSEFLGERADLIHRCISGGIKLIAADVSGLIGEPIQSASNLPRLEAAHLTMALDGNRAR
jgi:hypothetical protein